MTIFGNTLIANTAISRAVANGAHRIAWGQTRLFDGVATETVPKFTHAAVAISSYTELVGPREPLVTSFDGGVLTLQSAELDFNNSLVSWVLIEVP